MKSLFFKSFLLVFLLLLLLAGAIYYLLHDDDFVRRQIISQTFKYTGWQLEIGNDFSFSPGETTRLQAHDVLLQRSGEADGQPMLRLASLQLAIQPLSFFNGAFVIEQLALTDCSVLVARDEDGKSNWEMQSETRKPAAESSDETANAKTWRLEQLDISNCHIDFTTPGRQDPLPVVLQQAKLDIDESGSLTAKATGAVDGQPLSLDGNLTPLHAFWAGGAIQHEINLQAGEVVLRSGGTVDEFSTGAGAKLDFRFSGPEIAWVTEWFALPEFSTGDFDVRLNLSRQADADAHMNVELDGDLGTLQFSAFGELDKLVSPSSGNLDLHVVGPDLDALAQTLGQHWLIASSFELQLKANINSTNSQIETFWLHAGDDRISANGNLGRWPEWQGSELQLELSSPDLSRWQPRSEDRFQLAGDLQATATVSIETGQTDVLLKASGTIGSTDIEMDGNLGSMGDFEQQQIDFNIDSRQWAEVGRLLGQESWPAFSANLSGKVQRDGDALNLQSVEFKRGKDGLSASGQLNLANQLQGSELSIELYVDDLAATMRAAEFPEEKASQMPAKPLKLKGALSRPGEGLKFDISDADLGGGRIRLNGLMADINKPAALNATFNFDLPSLQLASPLLPGKALPDLPFSAQGKLTSENANRTHFEEVILVLGDAQARLDGLLALDNGLQGSQARFAVKGQDIRTYWPAAPAALGLKDYSFKGDWTRQQDGDHLKDLNIDLGVVRALAGGRIWFEDDVPQFDLQVKLEADDASRFNKISGQPFTAEPATLSAHANGNLRRIRFQDIDYKQGESQAGGQLELDLNSKARLAGDINSPVFDIRTWQNAAAKKSAAEAAQAKNSTETADEADLRFFNETPLRLLQANALDLNLNIQVSQLLLTAATWHDLKLGVQWEDKVRRFQPIELRGEKGGRFVGYLIETEENGSVRTEFKADGKELKLGLAAIEGQALESFPTTNISIDLVGTGATSRELAKSLSGTIRGNSGPGLVAHGKLGFFIADLTTQVLRVLNPTSRRNPLTKMQCTVYAVDISNGVAKVGPVVIQTDQVTAYTQGEISLITESIDLSFNTVARKGLGLSAANLVNPFFKVGGSLAQPAIELDATKGAISGGAMVATAGISVLVKSMSDRWLSGKDPCGDALEQIRLRDDAKASG